MHIISNGLYILNQHVDTWWPHIIWSTLLNLMGWCGMSRWIPFAKKKPGLMFRSTTCPYLLDQWITEPLDSSGHRWSMGPRGSMSHIEGLVQDCSISIANAMEILQSCTKPSIYLMHGIFCLRINVYITVSLTAKDLWWRNTHIGWRQVSCLIRWFNCDKDTVK